MDNQRTDPEEKNRESSIRWQGRTIEQFGYVLNLVLGLSVAGIGYEVNLLLSGHVEMDCWQRLLFGVSLLALVVSSCAALWCALIRLRNFRKTAEVARQREDGISELKLQYLRDQTEELGNRTWILLYWQFGWFALGVISLLIGVVGSLFT